MGRISFIGHSLGGIIIRASLRYLKLYKKYFHTFMTLSTPHLGFLYDTKMIVNVGIWLLKKYKKSKCLSQLSFSDAPQIKDCYMYRLSQSEGIGWFTNIILLASHQDNYSPFESSRMEMSDVVDKNTE